MAVPQNDCGFTIHEWELALAAFANKKQWRGNIQRHPASAGQIYLLLQKQQHRQQFANVILIS